MILRSHIEMQAGQLLSTIRAAPFLETVELLKVTFQGIEPAVQPATTFITPENLHSMVLTSLGTRAQAYILLHISLPPCCILSISEPSDVVDGSWDAILHPLVALQLGPLSFSSFKFHPRFIELVEQGNTQRCQVILNVVRESVVEEFLDLSAFDMSRMRTLDIDNTQDPSLQQHWDSLTQSMCAVETLVLRRRSSFEVFPLAQLPQLRELRLVDINMDLIARADSLEQSRADKLLTLVRERNRAGRTDVKPLERLVLHNCRCKAENVAALGAEMEIVVE